MIINNDIEVEKEYCRNTNLEYRKKYAQFFTPAPIAELMSKWVLGGEKHKSILEPAFGLGIFSRHLLKYDPNLKITAFEIDENIYQKAKELFNDYSNLNFYLSDYMFDKWDSKYDAIICNPPYFKFHDYANKETLKEFEKKTGFKPNGFTNLYTLFLLKSLFQLEKGGRCAYIVPSEFLNSDYGVYVKSLLLKTKMLKHIMVIDSNVNIFDDAITTASIILCSNETNDKVSFTNINSMDFLQELTSKINDHQFILDNSNSYQTSELNPETKWRAYYKKVNSVKFNHLVPFSNYAKVVRGIATGDNDYFTFNRTKAGRYNISDKNLLPCICHSTDVEGYTFEKHDFEKLKAKDKKIYLFKAIGNDNPDVEEYLKKGEAESVDKKYLTSHRKPWYSLEQREPAPIWVSVFNRNGLKFVRNYANIANLTTYHCIYPTRNLFGNISDDLLFAYLLTDTAKEIFEDNCREYGNGLRKFEPNDINKAYMLDLGLLPDDNQKEIENIYVNNKRNKDLSFTKDIDTILLKYFSK